MPKCAGSIRWCCARPTANKLPAGGALAVDRDGFAAAITAALEAEPLDRDRPQRNRRAAEAEWDSVIVATGPLTSPALAQTIRSLTGEEALSFFDAIAPIVHRNSIDFDIAWFQSRYDKPGPGGSGADYINCPLTREQYDAFVDALLTPATRLRSTISRQRRRISTAACRSK